MTCVRPPATYLYGCWEGCVNGCSRPQYRVQNGWRHEFTHFRLFPFHLHLVPFRTLCLEPVMCRRSVFPYQVKWTNMEIAKSGIHTTCAHRLCCAIMIFYMMNSDHNGAISVQACRGLYLKWFTVINKREMTSEELLDSYWLIPLQTLAFSVTLLNSSLTSSCAWMSPLCERI